MLLFAGSEESAQRAAMVYSLFATWKLHGMKSQPAGRRADRHTHG
ncbi:MAG: hypothetical protein WBO31_12200 [Saprospiraceae bacterium]